jgi:hypothetical protein
MITAAVFVIIWLRGRCSLSAVAREIKLADKINISLRPVEHPTV